MKNLRSRIDRLEKMANPTDMAGIGDWTPAERDHYERSRVAALLIARDRCKAKGMPWECGPKDRATLDAADAASPTPGWVAPHPGQGCHRCDPARLDAGVGESRRQRGRRPFVPIELRAVVTRRAGGRDS